MSMKLAILNEQNREMWKEAQRKRKVPENGNTCMALSFPDVRRKDRFSMVEGQTTFALHDTVVFIWRDQFLSGVTCGLM